MAVKAQDQVTLIDMTDAVSIITWYKLQASTLSRPAKPVTTKTSETPSGWTKTEPAFSEGTTNTLYTCQQNNFGDGTCVWGDVQVSSSYEAAKAAYNKADSAQNAAAKALSSTEIIVGTQTAVTGAWTGVASFDELVDGQSILYWLPYAGSGNATLNLTLSNGNTTGAVNCYYGGTTRLTTHYGAGNAIRLVYRVNANINGSKYTGWWADANNSGTQDRIQHTGAITAASAITTGRIVVANTNNKYAVLSASAFDISKPILYAGSAISANASGTNNYLVMTNINLANTKSGFTGTSQTTVFIKGILNGTMFTPVTEIFTTTQPTTEDGYYYISLGRMRSTTNCDLYPEHPIYVYYNGKFQNVSQMAYEAYVQADENKQNIEELTETVTSHGTDLSVVQGQISGRIWQQDITTAIGGIEVGGRNLLLKSGTEKSIEYVSAVAFYNLNCSVYAKTLSDSSFMVSFDAKSDTDNITLEATLRNGGTILTNQGKVKLGTEYKRYKVILSFTTGHTAGNMTVLRFALRAAGKVYIKNVKLEEGSIATSWTPAPEDTADDISTINTDILELHTQYTALNQDLSGFKLNVADTYASKTAMQGVVTEVKSYTDTEIAASKNSIIMTVSENYASKTEFDALKVGGTNLIVTNDLLEGYISDETGAYTNSLNYYATDYINVDAESEYCYQMWKNDTTNYWYGVHFYDNGRNYISGNCISEYSRDVHIIKKITTPSNAAYVRLSYRQDCEKAKFEKGNKPTDWSPAPEDLKNYADEKVTSAKTEIRQTTDSISLAVSGKVGAGEIISKINQSAEAVTIDAAKINLSGYLTVSGANSMFDALEVGGTNLIITNRLAKGYIAFRSGLVVSDNGYLVSDYINVDAGSDYCLQLWKSNASSYWYGINYYDSSKAVISSTYVSKYSTDTYVMEKITVPSGAAYARISYTKDYEKAKFEKGNKPTDWSPAPEDISVENIYKSGTTTINGGLIATNSITVDKLNVADLSAISATLGAWKIDKTTPGHIGALYAETRTVNIPGTKNILYIQPFQSGSYEDTWVMSSQYWGIDSDDNVSDTGYAYWYITGGGDIYTKGDICIADNGRVHCAGSNHPMIRGNGSYLTLGWTDSGKYSNYGVVLENGYFRPNYDNYYSLGNSNFRWGNIYSSTGSIITSDRNEKNTITALEAETMQDFVMGLKPVSYKYNNGTSGRIHYGLIAQDVEELIGELGMESFAGFIKSPKTKITDEETLETEVIEGEYNYALRYDEFIAPAIAVIQEHEERIRELETDLLKAHAMIEYLINNQIQTN